MNPLLLVLFFPTAGQPALAIEDVLDYDVVRGTSFVSRAPAGESFVLRAPAAPRWISRQNVDTVER